MKKILSICLCLALVLVGGLTLVACGKEKAKTMSEEDFLKAIETAETATKAEEKVAKLTGNVTLKKAVELKKEVTIDLNGYKITEDVEYSNAKAETMTMFYLTEGAKVTVKGTGSVTTDDLYIFMLNGTKDGTKLTVESGDYQADCSVVYVIKGTATVKGGTYRVVNTEHPTYVNYTLNILDANRSDAVISVKGGTFYGFNPAGEHEGTESTYVAQGYESKPTAEGSKDYVVTKTVTE